MGFSEALENIAGGLYALGKGTLQLLWGAFKLALAAIILPIVGIYYIAKGIVDFAKKSYKKLKEKRPGTKPKGAGSITGSKLLVAIKAAEQEIGEAIDVSEFEKKKKKKELDEIAKKMERNEIDGMQYVDGINEDGQDDILDAEFFKSEQMSSDAKDKNHYKPFTNTNS